MNLRLLTNYILSISLLLSIGSCQKSTQKNKPKDIVAEFYKGADISWVTEMEASNVKFYNKDGVSMDCFALMKSLGMNTIRLRAWVNPVNQWSSTADLIAKAKRAKALDMRLLINLHYSDSWADPGKQNKPVLWASANFSQLNDSVSVYTTRLMNELKSNGIIPDWVQVGNETDNGLLWPDAKASTNMVNYAAIIKTGCLAVKSVFPETKTMVHVSNGYNNDLFKWNIGGLIKNGAVFDMIGMSLYPSATDWTTKNNQILYNMNNMVDLYGKEIMVVEVGMPWDSPNDCKLFLTDLIAKVKSVNNKKGIGVLYWEPQSYNNWKGYTLGAFDASGKPSVALSAFLN